MIGDGMGLAQVSAYMYNVEGKIAFERCKFIGLHKSHAANNLITDSAAGASAFSIGEKTNNAYVGVDVNGKSHETILEEASRKGLATGVVVSSTIVHATPAAFIAHNVSRDAYEEIALDIVDSGCDLLIGGGQKYFTRRSDSLDLIQKFKSKNYFVTDYFNSDYSSLVIPSSQKLLFFTADGDPLPYSQGRDYMIKASLDALQFLDKRNDKAFFLMVEGSQIDWGGHANDVNYVISEMTEFNLMLNKILDWAEKDGNTLVIITGDHETGGLSINPGSVRGKLTTQFTTTGHSGVMIPVYAFGPGAVNFTGIYENTELYLMMKKILFK
ncbi:MAG: alkaline phosphatase [Saprospiraceae bacterium]|nr:alkaline phosphatase [Saprospiraceae bacterium]